MDFHVANKAIKATFIQTKPSDEFDVVRSLYKACKELEVENFAFYKVLGGYDILFLYEADSFEPLITKYGPIQGILKFNTLLSFSCYDGDSRHKKSLFPLPPEHPFLGAILIKLNPHTSCHSPCLEEKLIKTFDGLGVDYHLLGTLGWNEYIVFFSGENLNAILALLNNLNSGSEDSQIVLKTFSYLMISYEFLVENLYNLTEEICVEDVCKKIQYEEKISLPICNTISPSIHISAQPIYYDCIRNYWTNEGYVARESLGKFDIIVQQKQKQQENTWSDFLSKLLYFRMKFKHVIFSTNTQINFVNGNSNDPQYVVYDEDEADKVLKKAFVAEDNSIPFDYKKDLEESYGNSAYLLASQLYTFNKLAQDPLSGHAYSDMTYYPLYILLEGQNLKDKKNLETLARKTADSLSLGCELRSFGTFGHIEQRTGRYAKLKGGVQKALQGMQLLPSIVFKRIADINVNEYHWLGFINVWREEYFSQLDQVIYVPQDSLWEPTDWWPLWHEIGHIVIERDAAGDFISNDSNLIRAIVSEKIDPKAWQNNLVELAAEVIGFELGFCEDYDLYLECFWSHIYSVRESLADTSGVEPYAFRSFFVDLWVKYYKQSCHNDDGQKSILINLFDDDWIHNSLLEHFSRIEKIINDKFPADNFKIEDKDFLVALNIQQVKDQHSYGFRISKALEKHKSKGLIVCSSKDWMNEDSNFVVDTLLKGEVYWGDIQYPEAVLCNLLRKNFDKLIVKEKFQFSMATILTFSNGFLSLSRELEPLSSLYRKDEN